MVSSDLWMVRLPAAGNPTWAQHWGVSWRPPWIVSEEVDPERLEGAEVRVRHHRQSRFHRCDAWVLAEGICALLASRLAALAEPPAGSVLHGLVVGDVHQLADSGIFHRAVYAGWGLGHPHVSGHSRHQRCGHENAHCGRFALVKTADA